MTIAIDVIPYCPRPLQQKIHLELDRKRWGVAVCHRRFGKTVMAVNHLIRAAMQCEREKPHFAYIGPTYKQTKAVAWEYLKKYAGAIYGVVANETELRVDHPSGWQVRLYGADNPDALRGIYLDGVVLDEYALMPQNTWQVIRPTLADRHGWAFFIGTPNGKNQFWEVAQTAQKDRKWYYAEHKASQTNILPAEELEDAHQQLTEDEYLQEYECSFEASVKGAIFGDEVRSARDNGRIVSVPYDPALPVDTDWDLGIGDATAIWFSQSPPSGQVRLVDYYENSGEGLPHYAQILSQRGYAYGTHWAPHDIEVKELGSGRSRLETARALGIRFRVVPKLSLDDGIHAARMLFPKCWFDAVKCEKGLEALMNYRRDYNTRIQEFTDRPVHDWASHGADAFRYLAVRARTPQVKSLTLMQKDVDEFDAPRPGQVVYRGRGRSRYR